MPKKEISFSFETKLYLFPHQLLACSGKSAVFPGFPEENNPVQLLVPKQPYNHPNSMTISYSCLHSENILKHVHSFHSNESLGSIKFREFLD
jgi:hypothetical protein